MRKPREKIKLDTKKVTLGQYDCSDDPSVVGEFETMWIKHSKYANAIGSFIISFSELENLVNNDLATAINERSQEPGYRIIKYLGFRDKINLLKDDYSTFIKHLKSKQDKIRLLSESKIIYDKLCELSEFRNKVAHANWESLDLSGFVRTKIIENKDDVGIQFEKIKMTPGVLIKFRKQNDAVANKLAQFRDKVLSAYNREDIKNYLRMEKIKNKALEKVK